MLYRKVTLVVIFMLNASTFVICPETVVLPVTPISVIDEKAFGKDTRECLMKCLGDVRLKEDTSTLTLEKYLGVICNKRRTGKIRKLCVGEQEEESLENNEMADYVKSCLRPKQPTAFEYYYNLGKKVQKVREFMKNVSIKVIPLPCPEPEDLKKIITTRRKNENEGQQLLEETTSEKEMDNSADISKNLPDPGTLPNIPLLDEYSIFAEGLCYTGYLLNAKIESMGENSIECLYPCVQEFLFDTEKILSSELQNNLIMKNKGVQIKPEANLFEMVYRMATVKSIRKLNKVGAKWIQSYKTIYQEISSYYEQLNDENARNLFDFNLKRSITSYKRCIPQSCGESPKGTDELIFENWMIFDKLQQPVLSTTINDNPDKKNYNDVNSVRAGENDPSNRMVTHQNTHQSNNETQNSPIDAELRKRSHDTANYDEHYEGLGDDQAAMKKQK